MSESTTSLGKGVEEFSEAASARIGEIRSELGDADRRVRGFVQEYPLVAPPRVASSG